MAFWRAQSLSKRRFFSSLGVGSSIEEEKNRRFDKLCALQNAISVEIHNGYIGKDMRCLVDGKDKDTLTARTEGGRLVRFQGDDSLIGTYQTITITGATTWSLTGELTNK